MTIKFDTAFNLAMTFEVGPSFDPTNPATLQGLIDTSANKKACGFVNIKGDSGGCTKYGIAQNANPGVDVTKLTLAQAKQIYIDSYWTPAKGEVLPTLIAAIHFDTAVNMGVGKAAKLLQTALGVVVDGQLGPATFAAIAKFDQKVLCKKYLTARQAAYNVIVTNKPSQAKFAQGWLNRINALQAWVTKS